MGRSGGIIIISLAFLTALGVVLAIRANAKDPHQQASYDAGVAYVVHASSTWDAHQIENGCNTIAIDPPERDGYPAIAQYDRVFWRDGCTDKLRDLYGYF
jgi:hypothetical protein